MSPDRRRHRGASFGRGAVRGRRGAATAERDWPWEVEFNPDREIVSSPRVAVASGSNVIDGAGRWLNLTPHLIARHAPLA